ncbi:2-oxoglutarate dehydrogenase, E2 component, dihydrolipoamide succinyltransferase [Mycobacterium deserti]|uniref:Dihydrolipoamide acetyltransferase component of pyruvate dehydrogenase complex n=1 Tax=Mycobacterium deserti TaxID=2978347 RepID=A0ABT2MD95_9MYCO|nr:2-oxoglutarate dehydrogenase, E2 component, dihydrolipoamide succinyltransferase [Mycobacterium deserti]MCT7660231.1 2-oxoglutarate dehydrogenase, E2 component, dihydrolipoamide succinyltransferase [Mycobacterium deserti]
MATSVQMPALGESVTEGTVTRWLKQEGDTVEQDEPLLEVSTDKVDTEIPSPAAGVLKKIVAQEDDTVEVGGELAVIGDADEDSDSDSDSDGDDGDGDGDDDAQETEDQDESASDEDSADEEPADEEPADEEPAEEEKSDAEDSDAEESEDQDDEPEPKKSKPAASGGGESTSVKMPELGESVTEGTITRWLKKVGDSVEVDEPLVEVSTDKVDTEIPSPVAGTLLEISAEEDDTVEVGGELAKIGDSDAAPSDEPDSEPESEQDSGEEEPEEEPKEEEEEPKEKKEEPEPEPKEDAPKEDAPKEDAPKEEAPKKEAPKSEPTPTPQPETSPTSAEAGPYVTPLVRKLAAENNVDLASVKGTGVGGRIRKQDVLAAAEADKAPKSDEQAAEAPGKAPAAAMASADANASSSPLAHLRGTTQKATRIRQLTAKKTRESLQATAQLTQTHEVDMTKIVALRARAKKEFAEREGVNLTYLPFIARAVIDALKAHPNVNASYNEDTKEITYYDAEHLGFAVDTEQGLLSPVIKNAGDLSLAGLARAIADIAARARSGDLKPDELSGGTFTITNIGSQGALFDTPILVPPQAAMLGTGAIVKRPRVIVDEVGNESIGVRSVSYLPLTYDHRLIDGADAGRFLTTVKRRLEDGAFEADLGL